MYHTLVVYTDRRYFLIYWFTNRISSVTFHGIRLHSRCFYCYINMTRWDHFYVHIFFTIMKNRDVIDRGDKFTLDKKRIFVITISISYISYTFILYCYKFRLHSRYKQMKDLYDTFYSGVKKRTFGYWLFDLSSSFNLTSSPTDGNVHSSLFFLNKT